MNSMLVPKFLGGPPINHNRVLTCFRCANARDNLDVLGWPAFQRLGTPDSRDRILAIRQEVLELSENHLTPTPAGAPKPTVLSALRKRWDFPRTKVFAHTGSGVSYLGWTARCGSRASLAELAAILRFGFQGTPISDDRLTLFELPAALFHDAVWALIDHGAWVVPLNIPDHPLPFDHRNWEHWWQVSMNDIQDLRRRRRRLAGNSSRQPGTIAHTAMLLRARARANEQWDVIEELKTAGTRTPVVAPMPPRKLSMSPSALSHRKRYRKQVTEERKRAWLAARYELLDYKDRVKRGEALPATLDEQDAMEAYVLDLFDRFNAPWPE